MTPTLRCAGRRRCRCGRCRHLLHVAGTTRSSGRQHDRDQHAGCARPYGHHRPGPRTTVIARARRATPDRRPKDAARVGAAPANGEERYAAPAAPAAEPQVISRLHRDQRAHGLQQPDHLTPPLVRNNRFAPQTVTHPESERKFHGGSTPILQRIYSGRPAHRVNPLPPCGERV